MAKDGLPRLRGTPIDPAPRIVLVDPEIPQNTGSIARLCAALGCPLDLVGTLGFRIDAKAVRRAGLDYWPLVQVERHLDFELFQHAHPNARPKLFSAVAERCYLDAVFGPGDALVFGRESTGLPDELLAQFAGECFALPTVGAVRSLNLANAVSIVAYEAMRQLGAFSALRMG
jgi:tRNA (cytidine/uridine-2'-O-)-methyltransferase